MCRKKIVFVTMALMLASMFITYIPGYAMEMIVNSYIRPDTVGTKTQEMVNKEFSKPETMDTASLSKSNETPDKGSPMHAWKAIVAAGKKANDTDTITTEEFKGMRNWSARTRGYELQSLVAIGVLAPTGKKGEYKLLVNATIGQIDQINEKAKFIVGRKGRDGSDLGIDSYRLDDKYLGVGEGKPGQIAAVVNEVTGSAVTPAPVSEDFVQEDMDAGIVPVSIAINGDMPFTINGLNLSDKGVVADEEVANDPIKQQALLAALVDTKIVSPEAKIIKGDVADFSTTEVKTVMFKETFVTSNPKGFAAEFDKLATDQIAVIIAIKKSNDDIITALQEAGLLEQWGNRIIVMGVKANSPAADAFERLFGDKNMYDLSGQKIENILNNKDLTKGLQGAV